MTTRVSVEPINVNIEREERKRGFTLTEIAIVLGIVGLILGAIWVAAAAVYNNQRISHANTEVLQIAQAVRGLYSTSTTDTGLTTSTLITDGVVPTDLVNAAGTGLIDPWPPGTTTIIPTGDGLGFVIELSNVPQAACIGVLMAVAGANKDPSLWLAEAAAAAPTVTTTGTPITVVATPVLAAAAAAGSFGGCTSATANTLYIGFATRS